MHNCLFFFFFLKEKKRREWMANRQIQKDNSKTSPKHIPLCSEPPSSPPPSVLPEAPVTSESESNCNTSSTAQSNHEISWQSLLDCNRLGIPATATNQETYDLVHKVSVEEKCGPRNLDSELQHITSLLLKRAEALDLD